MEEVWIILVIMLRTSIASALSDMTVTLYAGYLRNRPQVSMVYRLMGMLEEHKKNLSIASRRRMIYEFFVCSSNITSGL